jgi:hypothetical protein
MRRAKHSLMNSPWRASRVFNFGTKELTFAQGSLGHPGGCHRGRATCERTEHPTWH